MRSASPIGCNAVMQIIRIESATASEEKALIRLATEDDTEHILKIWLDASRTSHEFISADHWLTYIDEMRTIRIPCSETYVYELNGEVIGFLSLVDDFIMSLFVAPDRQDQGVGRSLLVHAKKLRASLRLNVFSKNTRGVAFYERSGFVIDGDRIDPSTQELECIMHWHAAGDA